MTIGHRSVTKKELFWKNEKTTTRPLLL